MEHAASHDIAASAKMNDIKEELFFIVVVLSQNGIEGIIGYRVHFWGNDGIGKDRLFLFPKLGESEMGDFGEVSQPAAQGKTETGLSDFPFEHAFKTCVAVKFCIKAHIVGLLEDIFEGDVADKVLLEVFIGGGVGGIIASHEDFETIID